MRPGTLTAAVSTLPGVALIVTADYIARRLGLPRPLSADDQWTVEEAITEAQSDVEAYLGRAITPTQYTETGLWKAFDGSYLLTYWPLVDIVSETAETDPDTAQLLGTWTVVYTAGLDAANDPLLAPIRRYVVAAAMNSPSVTDLWEAAQPSAGRVVTSVSAEGQSVSYANTSPAGGQIGPAGSGSPGALPLLSSLDRWRIAGRRVFQRRGEPYPPSIPVVWSY